MWAVLSTVAAVSVCAALFFLLPYSPTSAAYRRITNEKIGAEPAGSEVFTEADIDGLPSPVQNYFRFCGYLDTPKMPYMKAFFARVDFVMSENRAIQIDYRQFNLTSRPERFALISSSLSGIPFEGLDSFDDGRGSMKGTLAKVIPLFDRCGESMNRACLVTWLAECLLAPSAALREFVTWEAVDGAHAKAAATWHGISASGIFTFAENGELLSFRTGDRVAVDMDGSETAADWSAYFRKYHSVNGILQPRILQSAWHYQSGEILYFNENASPVEIRYR